MENRVQDYKNDILSIIRSKISPAILSKKLQDFHENDIAEVMPELNSVERSKLYRILDIDTLSDFPGFENQAGSTRGSQSLCWDLTIY